MKRKLLINKLLKQIVKGRPLMISLLDKKNNEEIQQQNYLSSGCNEKCI